LRALASVAKKLAATIMNGIIVFTFRAMGTPDRNMRSPEGAQRIAGLSRRLIKFLY
jgi:hypothetical protein